MTANQATDFMRCIRAGEFVLMDGALGTELERRGVPFAGEGWSALAVRDYGEVVRQVHVDYIEAGAKLHIVNSFALARHVLEPLGLGDEFEQLNRREVGLFDEAGELTRTGSLTADLDRHLPEPVGITKVSEGRVEDVEGFPAEGQEHLADFVVHDLEFPEEDP